MTAGFRRAAAVLAGYALLSAWLLRVVPAPPHGLLAPFAGDAWSSVWFLHWWPWSIAHGHHPLRSGFVYAPEGYDLAWATPVPSAALLALPVTLLFGAATAFNVLTLLAPVLNGGAAFLLGRRLGLGVLAGAFAGAIYGFSPYEAGQLLGHLNLDLTFAVPLAILVAVERVRGRLGRVATVGGLLALSLLQFGLSVEVFASAVVFGGASWLVFLLFGPTASRRPLLRFAAEAAAALLLCVLVLSPWLWAMARDASRVPSFVNPPWMYSTDLLNLVVPTRMTLVGGRAFAAVSDRFSGSLSEQGGYLGLPLLVVVALLARERRRDRAIRALLLCTALVALCSLGPSLHVGRWDSHVPMPWWIAAHLPLLKGALPARFSLYAGLGAALAAGCWLSGARTRSGRLARAALLLGVVIVLLPDRRQLGWSRMPLVPFFDPGSAAAALGPGTPTVLVLPYLTSAEGGATPAMLWQWQSGMRFRQTGGYLSFVPNWEWRQPLVHTFVQMLLGGPPDPDFPDRFVAYALTHRLDAVVAGPGTGAAALAALRATGWSARASGGVEVFRVPPADALRFAVLSGDVWPSGAPGLSWLGPQAVIETRGRPSLLHVDARNLPLPATTLSVVPDAGPARTIPVPRDAVLDIPIPANGRFAIRPGATFSPRIAMKLDDPRSLSFRISLRPR